MRASPAREKEKAFCFSFLLIINNEFVILRLIFVTVLYLQFFKNRLKYIQKKRTAFVCFTVRFEKPCIKNKSRAFRC